jgi:hypothetical protein
MFPWVRGFGRRHATRTRLDIFYCSDRSVSAGNAVGAAAWCRLARQRAQGAALRIVGYQEFGLIVPRHPANPREVAGLAVGLHSESPGIGAEPVSGPGSVVSCQLSVVGCRVSGLICQPGANESSRPTCTSATGPAGAHDTPVAGNNFTAD